MSKNGIFSPRMMEIVEVIEEAPDVKTFRFSPDDWEAHVPGQFVQVWVPGAGEIPLSIASAPSLAPQFEITVKQVGEVTRELFRLRRGDYVGIRGPFGKGFPLDKIVGKSVNIVGGGIGLPPLMSFLREAIQKRESFGKLTLCYGARTPEDLIYREELEEMAEKEVDVHLTVDIGNEDWPGPVGVVTELCEEHRISIEESISLICGPGVMMYFTVEKLLNLGFPAEHIYLSLEQHMKCGVGKCGHCRIGPYYVCVDGPVFSLPVIREVERKYAGKVF